MNYSVAFTQELSKKLIQHLNKSADQEQACFCLWNPSKGVNKYTALLEEPIFPQDGEVIMHGDVEITNHFFLRALSIATKSGMGLALIHSHPGKGWQRMSYNDNETEKGFSPATFGATKLPFVGLTLSVDEVWSARFYKRTSRRKYEEKWCEAVRVVGSKFKVDFNEKIKPAPMPNSGQTRTVSAWGEEMQGEIGRLRIGIIGVGSVGSIIAEALARMGIGQLYVIDFDLVEEVNLDRLLHSTKNDAKKGRPKVKIQERELPKAATANNFKVKGFQYSIAEEEGFRNALDCDVLFSCVDRPWARSVLNFIAYAHLIPVLDGGILLEVNKKGKFKKGTIGGQLVTPGRQCMECSGQYDSGLVAVEKDGYLDDPSYIVGLPDDHILKRRENIFAFSLQAAAFEIMQLISALVAPTGENVIPTQIYSVVTGRIDLVWGNCNPNCLFPSLVAKGDNSKISVTARHPLAEEKRK